MRLKYILVLVLFLTGCQMTPKDTKKTPETNKKELTAPVKVTVNKPKLQLLPNIQEEKVLTPAQQDDLWQRIAMQLHMAIPENKKIDYYRTWYIKHPSHLRTVSKRAAPFLYIITKEIEKRNLPMELALLPIVESSFDAFAYSHGSAAGLWQFVPGTGKMMGLEQNYWYDGRRDVSAATHAALSYLAALNRRFKGNWYQSIAAYNSGGGRVSHAITKNKRLGKSTSYFKLDLPDETSSYVPKLLALADVIANHKKYGIKIPKIKNQPVLTLIDPKEQLDLAIAAKYARISVKELQGYNPAYNQWSTAPNKHHKLLIPIRKKSQFLATLKKNHGKGMKLLRYKVQSGDSVSVLAHKYKTTSKVIRKANGLANNNIRAGHYLLIPTSTKDDSIYVLSAKNRLTHTQSRSRGQYRLTHIVQSGDSLWSIANNNKVSHQSLAKWNGMGPRDTLHIGQKLVIWKKAAQGAVIRTIFYKVRSGDTISDIAHKFKVKSHDVVNWNSLQTRKYLKLGQKLKLYVDVTKVSV